MKRRFQGQDEFIYAPDDLVELDNELNREVELEPNHTHFILVDDGTNGEFGVEVNFRTDLEIELSKGKKLAYYQNSNRAAVNESCSTLNILKSNQAISCDQIEQHANNVIPMILIVGTESNP